MESNQEQSLADRLDALVRERARQDEALADAEARVATMGSDLVSVPRHALVAIDAACLVRLPPLTPALRG